METVGTVQGLGISGLSLEELCIFRSDSEASES